MNLVVEIGNTRRKIAFFEGNRIVECGFLENRLEDDTSLLQSYSADKAILSGSGDTLWHPWNSLRCPKYRFERKMIQNIKYLYETPDTLGEDRLINAYTCTIEYPNQNCLIVDCGTCLTTTFISAEGELYGGSISPGLSMRLQAMHHFTHKLPFLKLDFSEDHRWLGLNTEESMLSGALWGAVDEVNGRLDRYLGEFKDLKIIITGGDASFFENKLKYEIFADSILTLKGLNYLLASL